MAGNYAADILPNTLAKKKGFPIALYLDAKTNSYVEEFSTSNFLGIDSQGKYVTPKSEAILASITNKSLMQIAADEGTRQLGHSCMLIELLVGLEVEMRPIHIDEVASFQEVAACGTAVGKIFDYSI